MSQELVINWFRIHTGRLYSSRELVNVFDGTISRISLLANLRRLKKEIDKGIETEITYNIKRNSNIAPRPFLLYGIKR